MNSEVLNRRMRIDPSRITEQFTTIEEIDLQKDVDDQIEEEAEVILHQSW